MELQSTICEPRIIIGAAIPEIAFDQREKLDWLILHFLARRRSSSAREIGFTLPDWYAAQRSSKIFLCFAGTGAVSSILDNHSSSASLRRCRFGSLRNRGKLASVTRVKVRCGGVRSTVLLPNVRSEARAPAGVPAAAWPP